MGLFAPLQRKAKRSMTRRTRAEGHRGVLPLQPGMTMLIVTHEVQFAREVADKVAVMVDGVIAEAGLPGTVLRDPQDPRVRSFLARVL